MTIPVAITTFNQLELTKRAVSSLKTTARHELAITLVDNGSTDGTLAWARRNKIPVLRNPKRMNLAASWNIAMQKLGAGAESVLISNNDVIFTAGWDRILDVDVGSQIGVLMPHEVRSETEACPEAEKFENCHARGCCFLLPFRTYDRIGPFDESLFFYEDTDYWRRVLRRYKIVRPAGCRIIHEPGQTTRDLPPGVFNENFFLSRFRFYERHGFFETWGDSQEIVSVVIPVRDRPEALRLALESVFGQSFQSFRVYVILDNCSDERTAEVVEEFKGRDLRIASFRAEDYGLSGVADARNLGVRLAEGKYIAFLDSDDVWFPNHLEDSVRYHEHHIVHMTYSTPLFAWRYWNKLRGCYHEVPDEPPNIGYDGPFSRERLERENYILTSSTVWWGETIKRLPFPSGKQFEEDWDVFKACPDPVVRLDLETMRYHWEEGGGHLTGQVVPVLASRDFGLEDEESG